MHRHGPGTTGGDICARVRGFFLDRLEAAQRVGIARERLCFDPGVGFGKTVEENLDLIAHVERTKVELRLFDWRPPASG